MSKDLRAALNEVLMGRTAFVGVGNLDLGDDGFGVRLAEELSGAGLPDVMITHTTPENYIGTLARERFDSVVFLDSVSTGARPGSVVFLDAGEVRNRFPQVSTHKFALGTLAGLIQAESPTHVWLLGTEPASVKPGMGLSKPVEETLNLLKTFLLDTLRERRTGEAECRIS